MAVGGVDDAPVLAVDSLRTAHLVGQTDLEAPHLGGCVDRKSEDHVGSEHDGVEGIVVEDGAGGSVQGGLGPQPRHVEEGVIVLVIEGGGGEVERVDADVVGFVGEAVAGVFLG